MVSHSSRTATVYAGLQVFARAGLLVLMKGSMNVGAFPEPCLRVTVLIPLRDDWICAAKLLRMLDETISSLLVTLDILLVDDGSLQSCSAIDFRCSYLVIRTIRVLQLRRNVGHQRAIAIGFAHIEQTIACDAVLVMDGDGEDTPSGALELIRCFCEEGRSKMVFAARGRRLESMIFRLGYLLYKILHLGLTGIAVKVGNFSIVPAAYLGSIVTLSEMWNHYAAAIFRSKLPMTTLPVARGRRLAGSSQMKFANLVIHGMSAISVFGDIVGVRLIISSLISALIVLVGVAVMIFIKTVMHITISGWIVYSVGTLSIIFIQLFTLAASFAFYLLSARANLGFVPHRDYALFIAKTYEVYSCE